MIRCFFGALSPSQQEQASEHLIKCGLSSSSVCLLPCPLSFSLLSVPPLCLCAVFSFNVLPAPLGYHDLQSGIPREQDTTLHMPPLCLCL